MTNSILITGANRGIGLALTRLFADQGWQVHACCRNPPSAKDLKGVQEKYPGLDVHQLDVTDTNRVFELSQELKDEKIDILLNNAGISGPKQQGFGRIDHEGWLDAFRVNVLGPYDMTVAFADQVAASERKIVAIMGTMLGSIGDNNSGGRYAYRSSKAAVHMVGKNLSIDLQDRGIITILMHPGWVQTDMGGDKAPVSPEQSAEGLSQILMKISSDDNGRLFSYDGSEIPW